jgi:amidohydrolase
VSRTGAFTGERAPVLQGLQDILRPLVAFYLDLHRNPELSGRESRTASRFAEWLEQEPYRVTRGVGGHGVVGVLHNGTGPCVMLRAELDALPVTERTGLAYAAEGPVMHACGHDLHLAALAGAATLLARSADSWRGTVLIVAQPAEETLEGARAMLEDGLYRRFPRPGTVLAQHCAPLPAGMVAHADPAGHAPVLGGSVTMEVTVRGRGGHAGAPHMAVDPLLTAASAVLRLQGVVARETAPGEQAVLNVGSLHAGSGSNVIPDQAVLGVTVRALSEASLDRLAEAVERIVRAESAASGCPEEPRIDVVSRSPVTLTDRAATGAVREAHRELYGPERVSGWLPTLATEDFPLYGDAGSPLHGEEGIATVYWMLGAVGAGQYARAPGETAAEKLAALPANHAPDFAPDVRASLPAGVTAMTSAALARLGEPPRAGRSR